MTPREPIKPFKLPDEDPYKRLLQIVPQNFFGPCKPEGAVTAFVAAQQLVWHNLKEFIKTLEAGDLVALLLQLAVRVPRENKPSVPLVIQPQISWQPIETAPAGKYHLVACRSGYSTLKWVYRVAMYDSSYAHNPWRDEGNVGLSEHGEKPVWWSPLPNELGVARE